MKSKLVFDLFIMLACVTVIPGLAQNPVIASFSPEGVLVCSNLNPGSVATIALSSSVLGPWQTNWSLNAVTVGAEGIIQVTVPAFSVPTFYRVWGVPVQMPPAGMALVPAGSFTMGDALDSEDDATPTTDVYVSAFYMDTNLVSYSQWQAVYAYATNHGYAIYRFKNVAEAKAANHPVYDIDWYDCVKWCNARSEQAGKTPLYYTDPGLTQVYTNGETPPYVDWRGDGYRLPTEAEWEKAARGGLSGQRFPWGNTISESQANYYADTNQFSYDLGPDGYNPIGRVGGTSPPTSPVGSFAPNGYGLYDMAGNSWEWCWDWYGMPYGQPTTNNPTGSVSGSFRVIRGGSSYLHADSSRTAKRGVSDPSIWYIDVVGLRCVLPLGQ